MTAVLAVALGLAGCAGELMPQADSSDAADTVSTSEAGHLTSDTFLPAMKKAMGGKTSVRTTMRMVVGGKTATFQAVQTIGTPISLAVDMDGEPLGGKSRIVIVDGIGYLSMKGIAPEGKFARVDPADSKDPHAPVLLEMLSAMDVTKTFDAFDAGLRDVSYVATETVEGSRLDHYKATLDMASAFSARGQEVPKGAPETLVYDMWLGSDNLIRRVSFELPGSTTTMEASGWGAPVDIKAPPAADIVAR